MSLMCLSLIGWVHVDVCRLIHFVCLSISNLIFAIVFACVFVCASMVCQRSICVCLCVCMYDKQRRIKSPAPWRMGGIGHIFMMV